MKRIVIIGMALILIFLSTNSLAEKISDFYGMEIAASYGVWAFYYGVSDFDASVNVKLSDGKANMSMDLLSVTYDTEIFLAYRAFLVYELNGSEVEDSDLRALSFFSAMECIDFPYEDDSKTRAVKESASKKLDAMKALLPYCREPESEGKFLAFAFNFDMVFYLCRTDSTIAIIVK